MKKKMPFLLAWKIWYYCISKFSCCLLNHALNKLSFVEFKHRRNYAVYISWLHGTKGNEVRFYTFIQWLCLSLLSLLLEVSWIHFVVTHEWRLHSPTRKYWWKFWVSARFSDHRLLVAPRGNINKPRQAHKTNKRGDCNARRSYNNSKNDTATGYQTGQN